MTVWRRALWLLTFLAGSPGGGAIRNREGAMTVAIRLLVVLLALLTARQGDAGMIRFTFGLTRPVDVCEEVGDFIRYRSAGAWYHIQRSEVQDITGLTCTKGDVDSTPASSSVSSPAEAAGDHTAAPALPASPSPSYTTSGWMPTPKLGLASDVRRVRAVVTRVIDGDTIEVRLPDGRLDTVRYIGIHTPELHHPTKGRQPGGAEAWAANRRLVEGRVVELAFEVQAREKYGRLLAHVWADGKHVNAELVAQGYAAAATYPPNVTYADLLQRLQREAHESGRGLWADTTAAPSLHAGGDGGHDTTSPSGSLWLPPSGTGQGGSVSVRGYTRRDGTYVAPYTRSAPRAGGGGRRR